MSAMDALLDCRAAWERSQPQTFIDFDALTDPARDDAAPAGSSPTRVGGLGAQASSANPGWVRERTDNDEGGRSSIPASAPSSTKEGF